MKLKRQPHQISLHSSGSWLFYTICAASVVLACLMFNPFRFFFLNDDLIHIPLSKSGVLFQHAAFRPVCDLSIRLDYLLWGKQAWGYHLTNLLLHVINSFLVFFLSKALLKKYSGAGNFIEQCVMVSVLFFVYAFHSETIFWILGRSASLGALFFIPALLFYLKRSNGLKFFFTSILFFALGLLTYESVWIFPFVTICLGIIDRRRFLASLKREAFYLTITIMVFIVHFLFRYSITGQLAGNYEASGFKQADLLGLTGNLIRLTVRTFAPPFQNNIFFVAACVTLFMVMILLVIRLKEKLRQPVCLVIAGAFLLMSYLPYLSLGIDTHTVEGERFIYMPSIFAALFIVLIINTLFNQTNLKLLAFTGFILFNLFFLNRSGHYYTVAGEISKVTFSQINALRNKKRLFIDSLPVSYNGALIFRSGFEEGVQWLKKDGTADSIIILSVKQDNRRWSNEYGVTAGNIPQDIIFNSKLIKDTLRPDTYIRKAMPPTSFQPENDAWFIFTDSALQVIQSHR